MGPDPTQAYFWPAVNKRPTHPQPRYFPTRPEEIFFSPKGNFFEKFDIFRGNFPNSNPNHKWLTQPGPTRPDLSHKKLTQPNPGQKLDYIMKGTYATCVLDYCITLQGASLLVLSVENPGNKNTRARMFFMDQWGPGHVLVRGILILFCLWFGALWCVFLPNRGLRFVPGIEPLLVQSLDWIPSRVLYR